MLQLTTLALFISLWTLTGCGGSKGVKASHPQGFAARPSKTLSLIASNDLHGQVRSLPALSGYLGELRKERSATGGGVLLLDAGDMFQGTLETNLSEGAAVIELYNRLGYDAAALGNHEFDYGPEDRPTERATPLSPLASHPQGALRRRLEQARFPFLCANLVDEATGQLPEWPGLARSVVMTRYGLRIGVIGAMTAEADHVVKADLLSGLRITPPGSAVEREARSMRAQAVDLVVLLFHGGGECQRFESPTDLSSCDLDGEIFRLVRGLSPGLVDIVFGGHKHEGIAHFVGATAVAQAYWAGEAFSRVDVTFEIDPSSGGRPSIQIRKPQVLCARGQTHCQAIAADGKPLSQDPVVQRRVDELLESVARYYAEPLGVRLDAPLKRTPGVESALGNLFADLMRSAVPAADVAFANSGSLRAGLPSGELTYGAVYEAMPFDNHLVSARLSARELRDLLRHHATHEGHGPATLAGVRAQVRCLGNEIDVQLWRADGSLLSDDSELTVVTSDFVAQGGDNLVPEALRSRFLPFEGLAVRDALIQGLRDLREVAAADKALHDPNNPRLRLEPNLSQCRRLFGD